MIFCHLAKFHFIIHGSYGMVCSFQICYVALSSLFKYLGRPNKIMQLWLAQTAYRNSVFLFCSFEFQIKNKRITHKLMWLKLVMGKILIRLGSRPEIPVSNVTRLARLRCTETQREIPSFQNGLYSHAHLGFLGDLLAHTGQYL